MAIRLVADAMDNFKRIQVDKAILNRQVSVDTLKWCDFFSSRVRCVNGIHSREKGLRSLFLLPFGFSNATLANMNVFLDVYTTL